MKYLVIDYLEQTTRLFGEKIGVIDENSRITYNTLQKSAKSIASWLIHNDTVFESIPIYAVKSTLTTCALWGAIYAGCHYTFLDVKQPKERLKKILAKLEPAIMLTDKTHYEEARNIFTDIKIICIDNIVGYKCCEETLLQIRDKICCTTPLYVNFTSGTTGEPKGVVVSHLSVVDFIDVFVECFHITHNEVLGNQAPFDFDVSVKDIYSCAATGATLVIIPRDYFCKPKELMDYLIEEKVTTLIWAVSAMCFVTTMKAFLYKVPERIKKVMFSGEIMPIKHLEMWRRVYPEAMFVNLYGPTEITCNCTYHILEDKETYEQGIPIGKPFKNENVFLLNDKQQLISDSGQEGEICVTGITLALGYYKDEKTTKAHFIKNPLNKRFIELMYMTGDLAKYGEDGLLYYVGRKDMQIKHMGHRIELQEIEFFVNKLNSINRACCVFCKDRKKIILFYIGESNSIEINKYLTDKLPFYMIPNIYVKVESMPLTKNGKVDRNKLLVEYM